MVNTNRASTSFNVLQTVISATSINTNPHLPLLSRQRLRVPGEVRAPLPTTVARVSTRTGAPQVSAQTTDNQQSSGVTRFSVCALCLDPLF